MTHRQIELIENSWNFVLLNKHEAGMIFYNRLFEVDPTLRQLFKADLKTQSQKLVSLITFVIHKLVNFQLVIADVEEVGLRHNDYMIKAEYYLIVRDALLWTLEKCLEEEWNNETKEAWASIYAILSKIMIEASKE